MKTGEAALKIQEILGIPEDQRAQRIGPLTSAAFERLKTLVNSNPESSWEEEQLSQVVTEITGRHIQERGLALVKHFESLFLRAYKDIAGVWTIGYGHTGLQHQDGTVFEGRVITREKAEELLAYDMHQFESRVNSLVKSPLNQDQFDALVSFDFNTGGLTLQGGKPSTLLRYVNQVDMASTAKEFMAWNKVKGRAVDGLTRRRISERNLFEGKTPYIVEMEEFKQWKTEH